MKDDTTCLVVDVIPSEHSLLTMMPKNNQNTNKLRSIFGKRSLSSNKLTNRQSSFGAVEEIFEEGSAMLAERYSSCLTGFFLT